MSASTQPSCKPSTVATFESKPTRNTLSDRSSESTAYAAPTLVGSLKAISTFISGCSRSIASASFWA